MTSLKRASGLLLALALVLGLQAVAYAQTGAASITGLVTDQSGAATPGRHGHGHEPGHERRLHRRLERDGQLRHPVGARRPVRRQGGAVRVQDDIHPADHARGEADRPPRPEDGDRRPRGHRRGDRPGDRAPDRDGHRRRGASRPTPCESLPLNGRNANQLALLLPGAITPNPDSFTGARNSGGGGRPYINGNREQTNNFLIDGVDMNETVDNRIAYQPSPDALAEISVETNNYAADVGNVAGARDQQRHQVRREPVPRERVRVLPQQRLRREHVVQQPLRREEGRAHAAHLRRHARRPDHQEQAVLLRGLPGHGPRPAGHPRRPPSPRPPGAPGDLSSLLPGTVIRDPVTGCPSRTTRSRSAGSAPPRSRSSTARTTRFPTAT